MHTFIEKQNKKKIQTSFVIYHTVQLACQVRKDLKFGIKITVSDERCSLFCGLILFFFMHLLSKDDSLPGRNFKSRFFFLSCLYPLHLIAV